MIAMVHHGDSFSDAQSQIVGHDKGDSDVNLSSKVSRYSSKRDSMKPKVIAAPDVTYYVKPC